MLGVHFNELVDELEISAADNQRAYRIKVALLAALGYAYVIVAVAALIYISYFIVGHARVGRHVNLHVMAFTVPLLLLAVMAVRALWVTLPPPEGAELTQAQAPQLFALLAKIRTKLKGPKIDKVLIDDEFNACIVQIPRFGLFGGARNYLVIGLPLMQTLTVEQFAAVLAHEYGHLSGAHGHFGAWIYRLRVTWSRILEAIQERPMRGAGLFINFFRWYVPYFNAYTFVLARADEYEADRAAAEVAGAKNIADALLALQVGGRFMDERFWPTFMSGADKSPTPAFMPYTQLPLSLNVGYEENDAQAWLKAALLDKTGTADTHPCLKDRLAALDQAPRLPPKRTTNAAKLLLGAHMDVVVREFDKAWAKAALRGWGERHQQSQKLKARAAEISAKAKSGAALNATEWTAFGEACLRFGGKEKAEGYFRKAIEITPDHAEAHMAIAEMLLERRDSGAIGHLDKVIAVADGETAWNAKVMAARFLRENGRVRDAERYETKLMAQSAREDEKEAHRVFLMPDDNYAPNDLSPKDLGLCRAIFKRCRGLKRVRAFCKVMPGAGELHLVFVVEAKFDAIAFAVNSALAYVGVSEKESPLADEVATALRLNRPFTVFNEEYLPEDVQQKVRAVEGSIVFGPDD